MRVLVVAEDKEERSFMRGTIKNLTDRDVNCAMVEPSKALYVLKRYQPNVIVVCDYTEKGSLAKGFRVYSEIKERSKWWQQVVRVGSGSYKHKDYIMYPTHETPRAKMEENFRAALRLFLSA